MYDIDLGYSWNPYFLGINEDSIRDMFKHLSCLDDKDWILLFKNADFTPDKALLNNNKSINKKALLDYLVKMFNSKQPCSLVFHIHALFYGLVSYSVYKIDFDNQKLLKVLLKNYKKYHFYYMFFNKSLLKIKIINAKPDITEFELVNSIYFKIEDLPESCENGHKQIFSNRPYIINVLTEQLIPINFKLYKVKVNVKTDMSLDLLTFEDFSNLNRQIMNDLKDENLQPCVWCSPSNEKGAKRKCPRCKKILEDLKQFIKISYIATHENATKRKIAEYVEYEIKQLNFTMSKITDKKLSKMYKKKEKCLLDFCKEIKLKEDYFDNFDYRELEELKKSDKMKQYYRLCRSLPQTILSVFSTKWTNL